MTNLSPLEIVHKVKSSNEINVYQVEHCCHSDLFNTLLYDML
jgi:hypothetical protein